MVELFDIETGNMIYYSTERGLKEFVESLFTMYEESTPEEIMEGFFVCDYERNLNLSLNDWYREQKYLEVL